MGFHHVNFGLPIGLSVLELGPSTHATDRQTDTARHFLMPLLWRLGIIAVFSTEIFYILFMQATVYCDVSLCWSISVLC